MRPVVSQVIRDHGYATATFGKDDHYIYKWGPGQGYNEGGFFDHRVHFKHDLQKNGIGDLFTAVAYGKVNGEDAVPGITETVLYPDGRKRTYYIKRHKGELSQQELDHRAQSDEEYDLLRSYTRSNPLLIIGGNNPKPAAETIDAKIVESMVNYLGNAGESYTTLWGGKAQGADPGKPQFLHLGFHLPHTPVIPPKSFS